MKLIKRKKIENSKNIYNLHIKKNNNYVANNIVVSNCHASKAYELRKILAKASQAQYRLGFTGTLHASELENWNTKAYLGPIIAEYSSGFLADEGYISKCKVKVLNIEYQEELDGTYDEVKDIVFTNNFRLSIIKKTIKELDHNILILVGKVEKEGDFLKDWLYGVIPNEVVFLSGRDDVDVREKWRKECMNRKDLVIIATYGIFSQGINIPNLKYVMLGSPFKSKIRVLQSIGRALRKHSDKEFGAVIFDIHDHVKYLAKHGNIRMRYYSMEKFEIKDIIYQEGEII